MSNLDLENPRADIIHVKLFQTFGWSIAKLFSKPVKSLNFTLFRDGNFPVSKFNFLFFNALKYLCDMDLLYPILEVQACCGFTAVMFVKPSCKIGNFAPMCETCSRKHPVGGRMTKEPTQFLILRIRTHDFLIKRNLNCATSPVAQLLLILNNLNGTLVF